MAYAGLPARDQSAVRRWASTNVVNLHHDPVGSLAASAFVPSSFAVAWPVLIALALFGANRALGNWRTAVVCVTGHVAGTLVSEGIVDYRVGHGLLPVSATRILDIGPSYVVVSAIAVAVLYGSWPARVAAAVELAVLVIVGRIFGGLSNLDVARGRSRDGARGRRPGQQPAGRAAAAGPPAGSGGAPGPPRNRCLALIPFAPAAIAAGPGRTPARGAGPCGCRAAAGGYSWLSCGSSLPGAAWITQGASVLIFPRLSGCSSSRPMARSSCIQTAAATSH